MKVLIFMLTMVVSAVSAQARYGGGTGEPNDPYLIHTAEHLNAVGAEPNDWDKHFKLMADVDLSGFVYDTAPISPDGDPNESGAQGIAFAGNFDGNGHAISHLTIEGAMNLGLFGWLDYGAVVKNLGIVDVNVTGSGDCAGALVGYNQGAVTDCYSTGTVTGGSSVGGLVGQNGSMLKYPWMPAGAETIRDCHSTCIVTGRSNVGGLVGQNHGVVISCLSMGSVSGESSSVGGLLGSNGWLYSRGGPWFCTGGRVIMCCSTAAVAGWSAAGGLVGANGCGRITQCCATGCVCGDSLVGGLVGDNPGGTLADCYATGAVSGNACVGGLVAQNGYCWRDQEHLIIVHCVEGTITNCYATGRVSGRSDVGGLVGKRVRGAVACSFWDIETSEQVTSNGGTGKPTAQMQDPNTFLEAGWDFASETANGTDDIWWILNGKDSPRFCWQLPVEGHVVLVVDDFESYTNDSPNRVFFTWIDGLGWGDRYDLPDYHPGNASNGIVGHDPWMGDEMETTVVHGGGQSMPLYYNNADAPYYSETDRTFTTPRYRSVDAVETPQDWTVGHADTLTLYIHGKAGNGRDPLYVAIEDSAGRLAVVPHPDADAVLAAEWQAWHIPLADLRAEGVDVASVTKMIIGVGDRDDPQLGGEGVIYIDDIQLTWRVPSRPAESAHAGTL